MPSPYVKKGYGEVSKEAEDRIREDIIIKCKVCACYGRNGIMRFYRPIKDMAHLDSDPITGITTGIPIKDNYYNCTICSRNVILQELKT